jgi:hypothetical protein
MSRGYGSLLSLEDDHPPMPGQLQPRVKHVSDISLISYLIVSREDTDGQIQNILLPPFNICFQVLHPSAGEALEKLEEGFSACMRPKVR